MNRISLTLKLITIASFVLRTEYKHKLNASREPIESQYDFIVVGAGSAGAIVAHRLAESGDKVLLLEAGPHNGIHNDIPIECLTLLKTEYDWNYTMSPQLVGRGHLNGRIDESRGKVLGGSSSINGMIFNRGNRRDFDRWETEFGAIGWSYENVLPFFKKYERNTDPLIIANGLHGTSGPIQVTSWRNPDKLMVIHQKSMNEMGFKTTDINGPVQFGTAISQATIDLRGVRSSTANAYLDPNPFPKKLHIKVRTFVTKILFNKNTAIGVQFFRKGKYYKVMARKEVIVSAGAINSPQLLMLSGIGSRNHLESFKIPILADLPVGENHQNHPELNINFLIKEEFQNFAMSGDPEITVDKLYDYYVNNSGELTQYYSSFTYLSTHNNPKKEWPNVAMEAAIIRFPKHFKDFISYTFERREEWEEYYRPFFGKNYIFTLGLLELPRSLGYVRLVSRNPFISPDINPRFLTDRTDFLEIQETIKFLFYFYERSSFAPYLEPHRPIPGCQFCANQRFVYECDSYIICFLEQLIITGYHPVGGCRMGDIHRKDTVVDPRLRVKGINRLRVCDASIMPLVTNGNTNAPSMMIGEKCSQLIKEDN